MAYNPNQGYVVSAPVRAGMEVDLNTGAVTKIVTEYGVETPMLQRNVTTGALSVGGVAVAFAEVTPYVNMTATGTAFTGPCELAGFDCTVAVGNITIYDNTSAAGVVIVPTTALTVGRTEFLYKRSLGLGCHVVLSGAATVNVLVG